MNYVAHFLTASRFEGAEASEEFLVGAMMPDLLSMAGVPSPDEPWSGEVGCGIDFHIRCDAVFHRLSWFAQACSEGSSTLQRRGVNRGAARACAHVGIELLLDGALCTAEVQSNVEATLAGLASGRLLSNSAIDPAGQDAVHRVAASCQPAAYRDPSFVAGRLQEITSRRPRLALPLGQVDLIEEWLQAIQPEVEQECFAVVDDVVESVRLGSESGSSSP